MSSIEERIEQLEVALKNVQDAVVVLSRMLSRMAAGAARGVERIEQLEDALKRRSA